MCDGDAAPQLVLIQTASVVTPLFRLLSPGRALNFLLHHSLTEEAGSRRDFPKVLVVITDGKSDDPVEKDARMLRSRGVEVFVLGVCPQFMSYVYMTL